MKPTKHRDQVHRDVNYDPMSVALINTPQMQRLGRIYQLGFAHLVYRGATHTRLSHVMGAAAVAEQLVSTLRKNYESAINTNTCPEGAILPKHFLPGQSNSKEEDRWTVLTHLVKWGALLHDLGHIPIGHTLEDEFADIYEKHDDFKSTRMPFLWDKGSPIKTLFEEGYTHNLYPPSFKSLDITPNDVWKIVMLICLFKPEYNLNSKSEKEGFEKLYSEVLSEMSKKKFFHRYMAEIVSDTICADYIDYVQRDTLNVGFDSMKENRLIQSYFVGEDLKRQKLTENDEIVVYRMALSLVDSRGKPKLSVCTAAKNMVRHRFDLAETIYYHKTKVSASAMLAKVFYLIEQPDEAGKPRISIDIKDIDEYTQNLLNSSEKEAILNLKKKSTPDCLLHPLIGDESLLFWLQEKAWEKAGKEITSKNEVELKKALLAISLLEAIVERRLYKVAFSLDEPFLYKIFGEEAKIVGDKKQAILDRYRKNEVKGKSHQERENTEKDMATVASSHDGVFIIYVPGAKSQAKGIETGALQNGKVINLGDHSAVKADVEILNTAYRNLWRVLVFVHPAYQKDDIKLSKAIDQFLSNVFNKEVNLRDKMSAIKDACWFNYIPAHNRSAAELYSALHKAENSKLNWKNFERARHTSNDSTNPEEHADRAFLLDVLSNSNNDSVEIVKDKFGSSGSLTERIKQELGAVAYSSQANSLDDRIGVLVSLANRIKNGEIEFNG